MPTTLPRHALFATDFDRDDGVIVFDLPDEPEPSPVPVPPQTGPDDLAAARADGFEAGLRHGRAEAVAARDAQLAALVARLNEQLAGAADGLRASVDDAGERIGRLVVTILDRTFPALCARFGAAEVARFTCQVIALLEDEPRVLIRVHPTMTDATTAMLAALEPAQRSAVLVEADAALAAGDALVGWRNGRARRSTAALWADLVDALGQLGLGPLSAPPPDGIAPAAPIPDAAASATPSTAQPSRRP